MIPGVRQMMDTVTRVLGAVMGIGVVVFALFSVLDIHHGADTLAIQGPGTLIMLGCTAIWYHTRGRYRIALAGAAGIAYTTTISVCIALLTAHSGSSFEITMTYGAIIAILNVLLWRSIPAIILGYVGALGPGFILMLSQHPEPRTQANYTILAIATFILTIVMLFIFRTLLREMSQMQRQLIVDAHCDGLTGLANRRSWLAQLTAWEAQHPDAPYEIFFCDLDRFKEINDEYGHEMGDRVLIAFAHALRDLVPDGSTVARFGGDEFVAFIPGTDTDITLFQTAINLTIAQDEFHHFQIGVSVGRAAALASATPKGADVLWQADRALLENKRRMRGNTSPATA